MVLTFLKQWIDDCKIFGELVKTSQYLFPSKQKTQPKTQKETPQTSISTIQAETNNTQKSDKGHSLKDIFQGCKIHLYGDIFNRREVYRYLLA